MCGVSDKKEKGETTCRTARVQGNVLIAVKVLIGKVIQACYVVSDENSEYQAYLQMCDDSGNIKWEKHIANSLVLRSFRLVAFYPQLTN